MLKKGCVKKVKRRILASVTLLLAAVVSLLYVSAYAQASPYTCQTCGEVFWIEGALVNHMQQEYDVDIQVEGISPVYIPRITGFKDYIPVAYYRCPFTDARFFSEAALYWWLDQR